MAHGVTKLHDRFMYYQFYALLISLIYVCALLDVCSILLMQEQVSDLICQRSQQEGVPLSPLTEDELFLSVIGSRPGYLRGQKRGSNQAPKQVTVDVQKERDALEEELGEMKQKLQEESAARTVIQAQLQAESAARAEMEARLQAESAARTAMEARLRAEFMVALDGLRSQTSSSSVSSKLIFYFDG